MRRKFAVSLSEECVTAIQALAVEHRTNPSAVAEAALNQFRDLPDEIRSRLIHSADATKKAHTRTRWRTVFWHTMRSEFWLQALPPNARENEFAPRTFGGFQVWFLLNSLSDPEPENGPFFLETINNPLHTQPTLNARQSFKFERNYSPYDAAHEVADHIKQQAFAIGTMMMMRLPDQTNVLLDFCFASWRANKAVDISNLPITLEGNGANYILDRDFTFRLVPVIKQV